MWIGLEGENAGILKPILSENLPAYCNSRRKVGHSNAEYRKDAAGEGLKVSQQKPRNEKSKQQQIYVPTQAQEEPNDKNLELSKRLAIETNDTAQTKVNEPDETIEQRPEVDAIVNKIQKESEPANSSYKERGLSVNNNKFDSEGNETRDGVEGVQVSSGLRVEEQAKGTESLVVFGSDVLEGQ